MFIWYKFLNKIGYIHIFYLLQREFSINLSQFHDLATLEAIQVNNLVVENNKKTQNLLSLFIMQKIYFPFKWRFSICIEKRQNQNV